MLLEKHRARQVLDKKVSVKGKTIREDANRKTKASTVRQHNAASADGYTKTKDPRAEVLRAGGENLSQERGKLLHVIFAQPSSMNSGSKAKNQKVLRLKGVSSHQGGKAGPRVADGSADRTSGDVADLPHVWQPHRNPFGEVWQSLT